MNSLSIMKVYLMFLLIASQFIFAQTDYDSLKYSKENDSLRVVQKRITDSLKNEIKRNFHNYAAIEEYGFYDETKIPINRNIPKFYDSLFSLIEKDKKIRPEYYTLRANIFYTRGEERAKIFKKGFLKFPNDFQINSELGNYFYNKFIESNDSKVKFLYADSLRIHLDNFTLNNPFQNEKMKNAVHLYQVYYFLSENNKMELLEKKIFNKPFFGINLHTFMSNLDLKIDSEAEDKIMTFFYNVQTLNKFKKKFDIINRSDIYFNFILYRSFFKPIFIYLEEEKGKYFIKYMVSNKADEIRNPFETKTKEITDDEFNNFVKLLTAENIQKSSVTLNPGYDGSSWYLESKTKYSHTLQEIWSPQIDCNSDDSKCSTIKACLYLIKLSGLKTTSRKIDNSDYQYNPDEPDGVMIW